MMSIAYQQSGIALAILKHPKVTVDEYDFKGNTALCLAVRYASMEVCEAIMKYDPFSIDMTENSGKCTALILAAQWEYSPLVRALLEAGADPSKTDSRGGNALLRAIEAGNNDVVKVLVESADPRINLSGI